ncbi:MAG: hypothetical protein MZV49_07265 [Rhodopseudomonas palustris]|nr:hypothetical protein [Rhodopseudomonas palustris]
MVQPTPSAKRNQTFMLFAFPKEVQGNVVNAGVNELIIPDYKHSWAGHMSRSPRLSEIDETVAVQVAAIQGLAYRKHRAAGAAPGPGRACLFLRNLIRLTKFLGLAPA